MATREQLIEDFADHKLATGEKFVRLINSMKAVQEPVADPAASGTSLSFIDSIEQDADGKITATKKTLDLANAHELNPFKGWYNTGDTLPTDGFDGAYLYFKNTSELTGQTTIYRWNGTTYADTGTVVDTSNVNTFGTGQAVNGVAIDGTGLANPAANALAKAEDVLKISTKFVLVGNGNTSVTSKTFVLTAGQTYRVLIDKPNIPLTGITAATNYIFYVKNSRTNEYPVFVRFSAGVLHPYYEFKVEATDEYFIGMRAASGEKQVFTLVNISDLYDAGKVAMMPDTYYQRIDSNGVVVAVDATTALTYGIKHIGLKSGMVVVFHVEMPADGSTGGNRPYCRFVDGNGTGLILIYSGTTLASTREEVGIFKAPYDGVLELSFDYTLNNWYRVVSDADADLTNEHGKMLYPINKLGVNNISYNNAYGGGYQVSYVKSDTYTAIVYRIPFEMRNFSIMLFRPSNSAFTITRIVGLRDRLVVNTKTKSLTFTDVFGESCVRLERDINDGTIDEVAFVFQKEEGYTEDEYNAFGLENVYGDAQKFENIANIQPLIHGDNVPVGSIVRYFRGAAYKVVKAKPANSWGDADTFVPVSLIDTANIPLEMSHTEIANVMNVISANVGATNSNWKNAYGGRLFSVNQCYNRTTAKDMVRLMVAATKCPELIAIMGTETATVHIYGVHDRDKTLKNNSWDKLYDAYETIHGSGAVMPYTIVCVKPGATVATDGTDSHGNMGYATGNDGISNTGFAMVGIAKIGDKYVAFDAANVSSSNYTGGRLARAKATIELLDACKAILEGGTAPVSFSYLEKGAAAVIDNPYTPYCVNNTQEAVGFLFDWHGDEQYQPASTSKLAGGLAILSVLSNLEEYHSIWDDNRELLNDSGSDASSQETHVAYAGDVESVRTSLYAMMLVSNGANTLSLARMAGEKIIRSKNRFLNLACYVGVLSE